jgi:DNA mismatch repair protein MutL
VETDASTEQPLKAQVTDTLDSMTLRIQALPTEVIQLIAAGEVIDSLAAVVRELAENALDAGATRITVSLEVERWRVRVIDNGEGMSLEDVCQAATPHSTSKIRNHQDLWHINSLGFRGEALHSLAHLADLEICSRLAAASEGWRVSYDAYGRPIQSEVVAIAPGTIVTATDIFGNWLLRRQGLPAPAQQLRAIQMVIQQLALCHPQVTWQVEQGDRLWFAIWPGKTAQQILPQLLREVQPTDLQELDVQIAEEGKTAQWLYLLLGLPDRCHRHRPDWVRVAINGRVVKVPELEQTVFAAFRRTLPRDRYPVCFLHLHLDSHQIDWNRHPAKSEIYLHHLAHWQAHITQAIAQALRLNATSLSEGATAHQLGQLLKVAESQGVYHTNRSIQPAPSTEKDDEDLPQDSRSIPCLKAIAQVHNRYILAEHPTGVWLVEQHIAHERVLYEQLRDRWQLVSLDPPIILQHLAPGQLEQLQRIGVQVDPFGEQLWALRTAPEPLAQRQDCADALLELSLGGNLEAALVATACRTAIRNGVPLTLQEMQHLLDQWQTTQSPRTCPHGRPICLTLEESSLARFFRRHWVIGKSHGI